MDAWEPFVEAVARDGADLYFNANGDGHFTEHGHHLLWDWIRGHLQRMELLPRDPRAI
jgi:hypothetical protein